MRFTSQVESNQSLRAVLASGITLNDTSEWHQRINHSKSESSIYVKSPEVRFTPIYKARPVGKLAAASVRPHGLPESLFWSPSMFALSSIAQFLNQGAEREPNQRSVPQSGKPSQSGQQLNFGLPQSQGQLLLDFLQDIPVLDDQKPAVGFWSSVGCPSDTQTKPIYSDSGIAPTGIVESADKGIKYAALDWLLSPKARITLHERIMARLIQAEAHETDPWLRQDYRQAFICVSLASKGNTEPFLVSSYQVYGTHPDLVWSKVQANRHAKLAKEYGDWYDAAGNRKPDVPKKAPVPSPDARAEQFTNERLSALINFPTKKEA